MQWNLKKWKDREVHYRHQTSTLKCGKELEIASNANISLVQENLHEKKVSVQLQQVRDLVKGRWKEDCTDVSCVQASVFPLKLEHYCILCVDKF